MKKGLLIGAEPPVCLGWELVSGGEHEGVVIGSLTLGQLLRFDREEALAALAAGKPVVLYTPGLPAVPANRALAASMASAQRELKSWGVIFTDGARRHVITAAQAKAMAARGERPGPGAVLTPLAKEIWGESN